jgi:DNA mismatch endonuclease (patch repair protein)
MMARVKGKNTGPEIAVRRFLHAAGLRFRLHRTDLPGKPDIVLPKYRLAIFVHGCFWHRHPGCRRATQPNTRREFWTLKLANNAERDARNVAELRRLGWRVGVVWECETRDLSTLKSRIAEIMNAAKGP